VVQYVNFPTGDGFGWGVAGEYCALELARLCPTRLINANFAAVPSRDAGRQQALASLHISEEQLKAFPKIGGRIQLDGPLIQEITMPTFRPERTDLRGTRTVGYAFFEANLLGQRFAQICGYFDWVVCGSSWCTDILRQHGATNVSTVLQGVDSALFSPALSLKQQRLDSFVVFSGGKFEYRKGQDIVIRAFKVLHDRHRDVLLVNAWFNHWPATVATMWKSTLIQLPAFAGTCEQIIQNVLATNGIDLSRVVTLGRLSNADMPTIYRDTDIGLFPNRCEGGTNLVMTEYMACGKPVLAVDTTGQHDVLAADHALLLGAGNAIPVPGPSGEPVASWDEPNLDEAIEKLEWAYQHRDEIRRIGMQGAQFATNLTWVRTAQNLFRVMHDTAGQRRAGSV
jgi:glycosyltransferase involved in cell wall biosynthesis